MPTNWGGYFHGSPVPGGSIVFFCFHVLFGPRSYNMYIVSFFIVVWKYLIFRVRKCLRSGDIFYCESFVEFLIFPEEGAILFYGVPETQYPFLRFRVIIFVLGNVFGTETLFFIVSLLSNF